MNLDERLPRGFSLGDGLDARSADSLASVAPLLERALPLEAAHSTPATRDRSARARSERTQQLGAALEQALPLLESSRYDVQVLAVLLRLSVEAEGLAGCLDALDVLGRMLNEAWSGLSESLADKPPREQDKQRRKWARYIDAVFEQLYSWLARERERDERALAAAVASTAPRWSVALESIERGLAATALPVARFDAIERGLRHLVRAAEAAARPSEPPAARTSVRPGPLPDPANEPRRDVSVAAEPGTGERAPEVAAASTELRVSPRFWELERRLAAFDALLARGEYEKAGIVESDLRESLEHFDAAAYFPGLFARYFEGCAAHAERLARHRPDRSALRASALVSLYRTDLERFLELRETSSPK